MEKRVLVATLLSFLIFYAYQTLVVKPTTVGKGKAASAPAVPGQAVSPTGGAAAATGAETIAAAPGVAKATTEGAQTAPASAALVADSTEREIVVDTKTVKAVFTNRGAHLVSWTLKRYLDLQKRPQELVPRDLPAGLAAPFELKVDDLSVTNRLADALFSPSTGSMSSVDATQSEQTVTFEFKDQSGLSARKVFTFKPDGYVVGFEASVAKGEENLNPTVLWGPGLGDIGLSSESSRYTQKAEGMLFRGDKVDRLADKGLRAQPTQEGDFPIVGVDDHYFMSVALPKRMVRVEYEPVTIPAAAGQDPKNIREYVAYGVRQAKGTEGLRFFFGPKDFDVLAGLDRRMVRIINFGMFDWLAVPLLRALKWINEGVRNYGWSIILLTFLINLVIFPLRHKSMVSMKKMQELQPEMKAIQDRYAKYKATDPEKQKMNQEVMNLYKSKGVNPASGCIPMLLTFPVLFAFYSLLSQAIELRGQPWIWWIKDLSVHDPLYITPILMGITMVWQQKMTPSSADPVQAKMMMAMPLVFTFMFLWAPSGLVLYWFVSNILAIAQQYITNSMIGSAKLKKA